MTKPIACFLALLFILSFSACGQPATQPEPSPTPPPTISGETKQAVFLVDNLYDDAYYYAALYFAEQAALFSDGELNIEVRKTHIASTLYVGGNAEFSFLDSERDTVFCSSFSALSLPFLYPDYDTFSMVVNEPFVWDIIEEDLLEHTPSVVLGGFYLPTHFFLSNWQPADSVGFHQTRIALDGNSRSGNAFGQLGASSIIEKDAKKRLDRLLSGQVQGAEFLLADLLGTDLPDEVLGLYLTPSYHTLHPSFLVVDEDFFETLTPRQQAACLEASAGLYAKIDDSLLAEEKAQAAILATRGVVYFPLDISETREEVYRNSDMDTETLTRTQREILELVRSLS